MGSSWGDFSLNYWHKNQIGVGSRCTKIKRIKQHMKVKFIELGYCLVFTSILVFFISYNRPEIESEADLYVFKGQLLDYKFNSIRTYDYTFRLKEYTNSFQIIADFAGVFEGEAFGKLQQGEALTLAIAKNEAGYLNTTDCKLYVYSIKNAQTAFLDSEIALEKYNSKLLYYLLIALMLGGFWLLQFGYKERKNRRRSLSV